VRINLKKEDGDNFVIPEEYLQKCQRIKNSIIDFTEKNPKKGLCVLFHDTHNTTVDVLEEIITFL